MNIVAIVQARMNSTRLPAKVMKKVGTTHLIELMIRRIVKAQTISSVVVATSTSSKDQQIVDFISSIGFQVVTGSESDVLNRYLMCALKVKADVIVRLTADCPLIDPQIIDEVVNKFIEEGVEYASNVNPRTFPDGLDVEVFSINALKKADKNACEVFDREHVTPYIRKNSNFSQTNVGK